MNNPFRPRSLKAIDSEIERLVGQLSCMSPEDDMYAKTVDNVRILTEAREKKNSADISNETLLMVGANLLGILIVLNFERTGVITSKAFGLLGWRSK